MKKIISLLFVLSFFGLAVPGATLTVSNLITYGASGGASTNYGVPILIGTAIVPLPPSVTFNHAGLLTTNSAIMFIAVGTSSISNQMVNITTNIPVTNATAEVIQQTSLSIPIYMQTIVITTNNSTYGTTANITTP